MSHEMQHNKHKEIEEKKVNLPITQLDLAWRRGNQNGNVQ